MDFTLWYRKHVAAVEDELQRVLPPDQQPPAPLHQAMRYAVLGGGKRLRGVLVLAACEWSCGSADSALPLAAAVECIHAYSLIHDDLPAMDNADLRRGQAATHKKYGEAMAILAGDGLQALAFHLVSRISQKEALAEILADLAAKAGLEGMVAGQAFDMMYQGSDQHLNLDDLQSIHLHKTGALINSSVRIGAMAAGASTEDLQAITKYGEAIGLGFQIVDDLLDIESSTEALGKAAGSDADQNKITYPAVMGVEAARQAAQDCIAKARSALQPMGERSEALLATADFILNRNR